MTRQERREAMPTVTKFIDLMREDFPNLTITYASENGHTWGESANPDKVKEQKRRHYLRRREE